MFSALAKRTKFKMADRKKNRKYVTTAKGYKKFDPATVVADATILANFMVRVKKFGDMFNGKTEGELEFLLKKYDNWAPDVCLEIIEKIEEAGF